LFKKTVNFIYKNISIILNESNRGIKLKILLTNDDGIYSKGIDALYSAFVKFAEVIVVAPITEQSAIGHAITITSPLRIEEVFRHNKFFGYGVQGTPADCVKIAFDNILTNKPDFVISGINHGANLCSNIIYSGTVSAATEGAMMGVKSIAVSLATTKNFDFSTAAEFTVFFAKMIQNIELTENVIFNINVPAVKKEEIKGWKYTIQGKTKFLDTFEKRIDPRGRTYFWLTGEKQEVKYSEDSDDYAINEKFISVTPLQYDMTNYKLYKTLSEKGERKWL
jgi:5'-nucleotidase